MHSCMRILGLLLLTAACGMAGEYAVLANGSRLRVNRHETEGSVAKLYTETGCIEISTAQVLGFEADEQTLADPKPATSPQSGAALPALKPLSPGELADAAADKYGLP